MGNNIGVIKENMHNFDQNCKFFQLSLSKLREYHGTFKSVCENFSMDLNEFNEIFDQTEETLKKKEEIFKLWDNNENGLIDSFELFSGLVLVSSSKFEEKIRFLFDIFDLNELNSLSFIDLEYMLNCCVASTFRMCKIMNEVIQKDICEFLKSNLQEDERINISKLISFCCKSPEINQFLLILKKDLPQKEQLTVNEFAKKLEKPNFVIPKYLLKNNKEFIEGEQDALNINNTGEILTSNFHKKKMKYISSFLEQIDLQENNSNQIETFQVKLNWVYGFRCNDMTQTFDFHSDFNTQQNQKLIYCVSNVVVLFYFQQNYQKHYTGHKRKVCAMSLAPNSNQIATGDCGRQPSIHIWDVNTLELFRKIKCIHSHEIYALQFLNFSNYLACFSLRYNTPIIVYDLYNKQIALSCYSDKFLKNICPINIFYGIFSQEDVFDLNGWNLQASFFAYSETTLFLFAYNIQTQSYKKYCFQIEDDLQPIDYYDDKKNRVTALQAFCLNQKNPNLIAYGKKEDYELTVFTGHLNGIIQKWTGFKQNFDILKYEFFNLKKKIEFLISFKTKYLLVFLEDGLINQIDIQTQTIIKTIEINHLSIRLRSVRIQHVCIGQNYDVIFATQQGDLVQISLKDHKQWDHNYYLKKTQAKRFENIIQINSHLKCMCILDREEDTLVFIGGDDSQVYGFSQQEHDLIDKWSVGDPVLAMDCQNTDDGGIIFAFGTSTGKLILRYDWEEYPKSFSCDYKILSVKFSPNRNFLVACSEDKKAYIFILQKGSYFECSHKFKDFDQEIPLSINFSYDLQHIFINTDQMNHYKITLPDNKSQSQDNHKDLITDTQKIKCTEMKIKYSYYNEQSSKNILKKNDRNFDYTLPILIGQDLSLIISGDQNGSLKLWNGKESLQKNYGTLLLGHSSRITDFCLSKNKDYLYSIAEEDNALFEWKIDLDLKKHQDNKKEKLKFDYELVDREIIQCLESREVKSQYAESFGLFKGTSENFLNTLFREQYNKFITQSNYRVYPSINMKLQHVYGFTANEKRNTIYYCHFIQKQLQESQLQQSVILEDIQDNVINQFDYRNSTSCFKKRETGLINKSIIQNIKDRFKQTYQPNLLKQRQSKRTTLFKNFLNQEDQIEEIDIKTKQKFQIEDYQVEKIINELQKEDEYQDKNYQCNNSEECQRYLVYIVSRVAVIVSRIQPFKQKFYQGHKHKISCLSLHSSLQMACTGEASLNPQIHVWLIESCLNIRYLDTYHKSGIINAKFANNSNYIFSLGVSTQISIQISDWQTSEIVAFCYTKRDKILEIEVHPNDPNYFVTGSFKYVDFWILEGNTIQMIKSVDIGDTFVTNIYFLCYTMNDCQVTDLITTTYNGSIELIRDYQILESFMAKHKDMIACFKKFQIEDQIFFITAGHDKIIKIFDLSFTQNFEMNLGEIKNLKILDNSLAIQSLDIYLCKGEDEIILLIGTRGAYIIELVIEYFGDKFILSKTELILKNHQTQNTINYKEQQNIKVDSNDNIENESIQIQDKENNNQTYNDVNNILDQTKNQTNIKKQTTYQKYLHNQLNYIKQKKLNIAIHPDNTIIASVGDDKNLYFWDYQTRKPILNKPLSYQPTVCKFSPDGDQFVIGFVNGDLDIYTPKITPQKTDKGNPFSIDLSNAVNIKEKEAKTAVLNIEFSQKGTKMAVSFDNLNVNIEEEDLAKEKEGSYVIVYPSQYKNKDVQQNSFNKKVIRLPSKYKTAKTVKSVYGTAVYFMSFSEDDEYLMLYFQKIDDNQIRENETKGVYVIWDLSTGNQVTSSSILQSVRFKKNNFPNQIYGIHKLTQTQNFNNEFFFDTENLIKENQDYQITVSAIQDTGNFSILGSLSGELYLIKNSFLYIPLDKIPEDICLDDYVQGRTYAGHSSFVNQIELTQKKDIAFTTGIYDEAIFQWSIQQVDEIHELDHQELELRQEDYFLYEVSPEAKFQTLLGKIKPMRDEIINEQQNKDIGVFPKIRLEVHKIIGRKAFDRKGNVQVTANKQIVYSIGTSLVLYNLERNINESISTLDYTSQDKIQQDDNKQQYIFDNILKVPTEIVAFCLTPDLTQLCYGTQENGSQFTFVDIMNLSIIKKFTLPEIATPLLIRFSDDQKHIAILGITVQYKSAIFLLDYFSFDQIASITLNNSLNFKIKDLQFLPGKNNEFVTVGIHHTTFWQYKAGNLEFQEAELEVLIEKKNQTNTNQQNQKDEDQYDLSCFLAICYLYTNIFVTCCDSGRLYLWYEKKIKEYKQTQDNSAILALRSSSEYQNDFIAGNLNGIIMYYRLETGKEILVLQQLFSISIVKDQIDQTMQNQIQSLDFYENNHIVYGTRSGDIGQIKFDFDFEENFQNRNILQDNIQESQNSIISQIDIQKQNRLLTFFDHQTAIACEISKDEKYLFVLTKEGYFYVYDMYDTALIKSFQMKGEGKELKVTDKLILIAFEDKILVIQNEQPFEKLENFNYQNKKQISKMTISADYNLMAVVQKKEQYIIDIIKIEDDKFKNLYDIKTEEIDLLDFSIDSVYMVFRDISGRSFCYNIDIDKDIKSAEKLGLEKDINIQWLGEGMLLNENTSVIQKEYSQLLQR